MRKVLIVIAAIVVSVLLSASIGNRIARLMGASSMEGGDAYMNLCYVMPVFVVVGSIVGIGIAAGTDRR